MIYHYCNIATFKSIIATKQIWLTDITKLNDKSEYKSGFDIIQETLKDIGLSEQAVFKEITADKLNNNFQILVACFSKEGDVGSQWRLYAEDSKGLSIGFDKAEIEQFNMFNRFTENGFQPIASHVKFFEVTYDELEFKNDVKYFIEKIERNSPILKYQLMSCGLRRFAAIYKDTFFKDEREIRGIVEIEPGRDHRYVLNERVNAYKENAIYHKLLISYQTLSAIKEVIIGPNCPLTKEDVDSILHEHCLEGVTLRYSSGRGKYRIVPDDE